MLQFSSACALQVSACIQPSMLCQVAAAYCCHGVCILFTDSSQGSDAEVPSWNATSAGRIVADLHPHPHEYMTNLDCSLRELQLDCAFIGICHWRSIGGKAPAR